MVTQFFRPTVKFLSARSEAYSYIKITFLIHRIFLSSSFSETRVNQAVSLTKDEDNTFYLSPQILANSSSLSGHSGCSEFSSGVLLSIADLIISSDGLA